MLTALAVAASLPVNAVELAAEVYRDDSITIQAGLRGTSSQVVHFGDVLALLITVLYDGDGVLIQELDETLFESAWPAENGAHLVDWRVRHTAGAESRQYAAHAIYRFQILGCPDDDAPTCPGDRTYLLPEFELGVEDLNGNENSARLIRFRPWPENLTVSTTLESDDEDQLLTFKAYFPAGGYPDPMVGENGIQKSFVTAGVCLALLMGGLIMWPFRSGAQEKTVAEQPRWRQQLKSLDEDDSVSDERYLDTLRRCFVWYCNDVLQLDPFVWLDLAETGDESVEHQYPADLRPLFRDMLHDPAGQRAEFRKRLELIIATEGAA